jgi:paraquat-inducible protein B
MPDGVDEQTDEALPAASEVDEAVVEERGRISVVWVIPVVALLVGAWLAFVAISQRGPTVTISFESAEGLEAGKTQIKFKDVEIGSVESIEVSADLERVVVGVRLVKGYERFLTENTRFWVVRAQVSAQRITGLNTLFSGAYIGFGPSEEGEPKRDFVGLEVAPVVTYGEPGRLFTLRSPQLGSLEIGSPVYYRWFQVGHVVARELDASGNHVNVQVFIHSPHDERVKRNTVFWNASGVDLSLTADGLQIDTISLTSMLIGGVAFDTPANLAPGGPVEAGAVFPLYPNQYETTQAHITETTRFVVYFDQDVGGLVPGAPVEFRGIKIGEVRDVRLVFDAETQDLRIPVLIEVQPQRLEFKGSEAGSPEDDWDTMVARGMRAQLKTGNLLTGRLAIGLDLHPDALPANIDWNGPVPELPSVTSPIEELKAGLMQFMRRLDDVPIEEIAENLRATLAELNDLGRRLNADLTPALVTTMEHAEHLLSSADSLIAPDSQTSHELRRLLLELGDAARSIRILADRLERHPEELFRGRESE